MNVPPMCCHWPKHEAQADCDAAKWNDGSRKPAVLGPRELRACWCYDCLDMPELGIENPVMRTFIVCPACGNKRCPRATDHRFACTGSNEGGQFGSRYGERVFTSAKKEGPL